MSHRGQVGPREAVAGQQHVADQRLDRRLAHQPDEEQLLDHLRRDGGAELDISAARRGAG